MDKFIVDMVNGRPVMTDEVRARMGKVYREAKDGPAVLLFGHEPDWDTDQQRKFFNGPVRKHFVKGYKQLGFTCGIEDVRQFLKAKYLGYDESQPIWQAVKMLDYYHQGKVIAASTVDIETFLSTQKLCAEVGVVLPLVSMTTLEDKDAWHTFLNSCDALSWERFGCNLPTDEQIE